MTALSLDVRVGDPVSAGRITLFPLHPRTRTSGPRRYRCAPEAAAAGLLTVSEKGGGEVPILQLDNRGETPLLVLAGEIINGNRQNRSVNVSLLAPGKAVTDIPVACVERGRWGSAAPSSRATHLVPPQVRRTQTQGVARSVKAGAGKGGSQQDVWHTVADILRDSAVPSPTEDLTDVFEAHPEARERAGELRPVEGQIGVVAALDGRVVSMDLFRDADVLLLYWDDLVTSYSAAALTPHPEEPYEPRTWRRHRHQDGVTHVERLLATLRASDVTTGAGVGLGQDVHLESPGLMGSGLTWEGELIHLAAHALT